MEVLNEIRTYRSMLKGQMTNPPASLADSLSKKDKEAAALENSPQGSPDPSFGRLNNAFASLLNILQETDMPPTTQTNAAVKDAQKQLDVLLKKWNQLKTK